MPPYSIVFRDGGVNFQESDGWYHMRLVENFIHHPPYRIDFDPYARFPGGERVAVGPLYDVAMGWTAIVAGAGAPSPQLVQAIGAWFPAVLGALAVLPVFFLGTLLWGRSTGFFSATLIALMPGFFVRVSQLGFPDHHVAEALLSAATVCLLTAALESAGRRAVVCAAAAGIALGAYLCTWVGGAFLVAILTIWALGTCAWMHLRGQADAWRPAALGAAVFAAAGVVFLPARNLPYAGYSMAALAGAIVACIVLGSLAYRRIPRAIFAIILAAIPALAAVALFAAAPKTARDLMGMLSRLAPASQNVTELRPLLYYTGEFSWLPAWDNFGASFFLAAIGLAVLWRRWGRDLSPARSLFLVWSSIAFAAMLGQVRMIAYSAVPVALLAGFACDSAVRRGSRLDRALAWLFVAGAVVAPNIALGVRIMQNDAGPTADWRAALQWLRTNTPEPFGSADFFFARYPDSGFQYPAGAYGVMNWWDYGYWITAIAHRIPVSNPTQGGSREAEQFFDAQDEDRAGALMRKTGARYVVVSRHTPVWNNPKYVEVLDRNDGSGARATVFYPEYFQTMASRLYLFDGQAAEPRAIWLIQRIESQHAGQTRAGIGFAKQFQSFGEATAWRAEKWRQNPAADLRIVSFDEHTSCAPVEALKHYQPVFLSHQDRPFQILEAGSAVKIFEFR